MSKRGFILPLIIIIVAVAALAGAFYIGKKSSGPTTTNPVVQASPVPSPTADATANWKTYTNTKLGFSIKYPPNLSVEEIKTLPTVEGIDFIFEKAPNCKEFCFNTIRIAVTNVPIDTTILQAIENGYSGVGSYPLKGIVLEETTIGGIKGFASADSVPAYAAAYDDFVIKNNKLYSFRLSSNDDKYRPFFKQILSTFKFTNPAMTTTTTPVPTKVKITVSGQVYSDDNCNMVKDTAEKGLAGFEVNIEKIPDYTLLSTMRTDSNGMYAYSTSINSADSLTVRPIVTSLPGYEDNPKFRPDYGIVTLSATNTSAAIDLYQLPYSGIKNCR